MICMIFPTIYFDYKKPQMEKIIFRYLCSNPSIYLVYKSNSLLY